MLYSNKLIFETKDERKGDGEMKVISDYENLVGKTIAFSHMAQFADQITLATTDGEVLMATFEGDGDDLEIRVFHQHNVIGVLQRDKYLREELDKLGIFNLAEWKAEQARQQKERVEKSIREQEERERKLLAELKAKYE
jgi:hypothetical protein